MPIKILYVVLVFASGVVAQATIDQCTGDDNNDRQVALMENTLNALLAMKDRLQSIDGRLQAMESRQKLTERLLKEDNGGMKCRKSNGERSCYKLVRAELTWTDARAYCQSLDEGADLVSIETRAEHMFLTDMTQELPHECELFFTSGRKGSGGVWIWRATGEPFTYTAWGVGEPSNTGGVEDACHIWSYKGENKSLFWNDIRNNRELCFICELR